MKGVAEEELSDPSEDEEHATKGDAYCAYGNAESA